MEEVGVDAQTWATPERAADLVPDRLALGVWDLAGLEVALELVEEVLELIRLQPCAEVLLEVGPYAQGDTYRPEWFNHHFEGMRAVDGVSALRRNLRRNA